MSLIEDDYLDFGDDDDGDFLTGKLAALGIDEDLELSGGEEENDDPATLKTSPETTTKCPVHGNQSSDARGTSNTARNITGGKSTKSANITSTPSFLSSSHSTNGGWGNSSKRTKKSGREDSEDWSSTPLTRPPKDDERPAAPTVAAIEEGEVGAGQLQQLLENPLQASRPGSSQQRQEQEWRQNSRKGGGRKKRGQSQNNGRAKGRNVTIKECAKWVCERLGEPKYYLMCQVVAEIGYNNTKRLLEEVRQTQEAGGMHIADGSRKRTAGGVFFTLLKRHMEPKRLRALYADEIRVKKEKERARRAANKRKAAAVDAGEDVTLTSPRNLPRRQFRASSGESTWGNSGQWAGPTFDSDAKRSRAASP